MGTNTAKRTAECEYTVQWSPRGDRGVVRNYRRTREMHENVWKNLDGHWYLLCKFCGEFSDVQA